MTDLNEFLKDKLKDKYNNNVQNLSYEERERNLQEWLGNSEIRDVLYHGSVHDFEIFDMDYSNYQNYIGKGFYFSSTIEDVNKNYANLMGGDLVSKINFLKDDAEYLISEYEDDYDNEENYVYKFINRSNSNLTSDEFYDLERDEQIDLIQKQLIKEQLGNESQQFAAAIYPVYIKMENPFYADNLEYLEEKGPFDDLLEHVIQDEKIQKYLEDNEIEIGEFEDAIKQGFDIHIQMYYGVSDEIDFDSQTTIEEELDLSSLADDEDEQQYLAEVIDLAIKKAIKEEFNDEYKYDPYPTGSYMDLTNELIKLFDEKDIDTSDILVNIKNELATNDSPMNYQRYVDMLKMSGLIDSLGGNANILHNVSEHKGVEIQDILRQCIQRLGYDGFVMAAAEQFKHMDGVQKGETMHYIVFQPTQIKSAIGNNGLFNKEDPRFAFKLESYNTEQNILKINEWEIKTEKVINLFESKYPSLKGQIDLYKDINDVPKHLKDESEKVDGMASGIFDKKTNKTAIFLFNIRNEKHLENVIAHEVIGHLGIKNVLGGAYDEYLISAYKYYDKKDELKELKHKYGKVFEQNSHNYEYKKMIAEEKIAETIEKYGVKEIPYYKTIVGNIKNKIRQVFPSLDIPVTSNDINYLISRSYSHFKKEKIENKLEKKKLKL